MGLWQRQSQSLGLGSRLGTKHRYGQHVGIGDVAWNWQARSVLVETRCIPSSRVGRLDKGYVAYGVIVAGYGRMTFIDIKSDGTNKTSI